ncbi:hypothetical protein GWK47_024485 [Chionoecetes opilio]|uniref:Uncharacterized protein n=1 Tax=Chionoecetes opilio TaxID=41210 RepID=A0A8J4XVE0_CHIOP|nr:hypothetical protein GWK47_024485 [Chionoecetes opilio]
MVTLVAVLCFATQETSGSVLLLPLSVRILVLVALVPLRLSARFLPGVGFEWTAALSRLLGALVVRSAALCRQWVFPEMALFARPGALPSSCLFDEVGPGPTGAAGHLLCWLEQVAPCLPVVLLPAPASS